MLAGITPSLAKEFVLDPASNKGVVVIAVTHDLSGAKIAHANFYLNGRPSVLGDIGLTSQSTDLLLQAVSDFWDSYGRLYVIELPAGRHHVKTWRIHPQGAPTIHPTKGKPEPLAFDVVAGQATYIGNLHAVFQMGKFMLLPKTVVVDGFPEVRDKRKRDIALAEKKHPELKGKISVALLAVGPWTSGLPSDTLGKVLASKGSGSEACGTCSAWEFPQACRVCEEWNTAQAPFQVYGNTYYVGVRGVSSILITSAEGHVLIDGGLPESAPLVAASIRQLGFRIEDVKLILSSHVHFDHAGGIAELQRLSGAEVAASEPGAKVFKEGASGPDDPQYGTLPPIPTVEHVRIVTDAEAVRVGPLELTPYRTAGHTRGGTSWTWKSCEGDRCVSVVYADSISPVSATGFRFSDNPEYPDAVQDFEKSFATLSDLTCDVFLSPHPEMSDTWVKLRKRDTDSDANAFIATGECRSYVEGARERLGVRIAAEQRCNDDKCL